MTFDLQLISKYRTQLMGVAMIWVVFFHSSIEISGSVYFIKKIGYGGVDMFLFLSGMGAYFSLYKNERTFDFYKRRAKRILPAYLLIVFIFSLINTYLGEYSYSRIFYNLTTLSYWFNSGGSMGFDWYIPSLLVLYLITPLFYKAFKRKRISSTLIISIIGIFLSLFCSNTILLKHLSIFLSRIPIYFIGFIIGYYIKKNYQLNTIQIIILAISFFIGIVSLYTFIESYYHAPIGFYWYPFILTTFPLIIIITKTFFLFKDYKYPIITFFGSYSLVIYLYHERFLFLTDKFINQREISNILAIIITLLAAFITQKTISKILK